MTPEHDRNQLIVGNEEDAWSIFENALQGAYNKDEFELVFENWPIIDIELNGEKFKASLTAKNMEGLVEIQRTINRSYALAKYNTANINKLTLDEKNSLEVVYRVSKGSSGIEAYLQKALETLSKDMADKMEPSHYIILVLGAGLLWGGTVCWRSWLQHRKDVKQEEERTKQKKVEEESRQFVSQQETERMKIMAKAVQKEPVLGRIHENTDEMYNEVIKGTLDADYVSIAGAERIPVEIIKNMVRQERAKAKEDRIDGLFRIIRVDSSRTDSFYVTVRDLATFDQFTAEVQDTLSGRNKKCIQNAEWNRLPVYLKINVKKIRGAITRATVLSAKDATEEMINDLKKNGIIFEIDEPPEE